MIKTIKIKESLGDCLIAGACVQKLAELTGEKINLVTNMLLEPVFQYHPLIQLLDDAPIIDVTLRWVSQLRKEKDINLYGLHTSQRFSHQLGFAIDPTYTLDIYGKNHKAITPSGGRSKRVAINIFSAEANRRFIPDYALKILLETLDEYGYEIAFLGDCGQESSTRGISESIEIITNSKLFIGPVSFQYHLASALKVKSLLFCSYMPYYKFSDFINTIAIYSDRGCVQFCEEFEKRTRKAEDCWGRCKAIEYNHNTIREKVLRCLGEK